MCVELSKTQITGMGSFEWSWREAGSFGREWRGCNEGGSSHRRRMVSSRKKKKRMKSRVGRWGVYTRPKGQCWGGGGGGRLAKRQECPMRRD